MVTATTTRDLYDALQADRERLSPELTALQQDLAQCQTELAAAQQKLKNAQQAVGNAKQSHNDRVNEYNLARSWQFLDCQRENNLIWCSYGREFLPSQSGEVFYLLHILEKRVNEDEYDASYRLHQTPSLELSNEHLGGYHRNCAVPVVLVERLPLLVVQPDPSSDFPWDTIPFRFYHRQAWQTLSGYPLSLPNDVPDDLAEKYGIPPRLDRL